MWDSERCHNAGGSIQRDEGRRRCQGQGAGDASCVVSSGRLELPCAPCSPLCHLSISQGWQESRSQPVAPGNIQGMLCPCVALPWPHRCVPCDKHALQGVLAALRAAGSPCRIWHGRGDAGTAGL